MVDYVHGYSKTETKRLNDQADILESLLYYDINFSDNSHVLEIGCGVGAQTVRLLKRNKSIQLTSIDISQESLAAAKSKILPEDQGRVHFQQVDIYRDQLVASQYDYVFFCFILEHLRDPLLALSIAKEYLKPGGVLYIIEGDHGSFCCHPWCTEIDDVVSCLVTLQQQKGGDSTIGRRLYPLAVQAGYTNVSVEPVPVYVDSSNPDRVEGFSKNTFTAMVEGVKEEAIQSGLIDSGRWERGIQGLHRATKEDGTFYYSFFKARGISS
jgi:ubiquinone/menaquinone biosynthesis C-methylase UbiE